LRLYRIAAVAFCGAGGLAGEPEAHCAPTVGASEASVLGPGLGEKHLCETVFENSPGKGRKGRKDNKGH